MSNWSAPRPPGTDLPDQHRWLAERDEIAGPYKPDPFPDEYTECGCGDGSLALAAALAGLLLWPLGLVALFYARRARKHPGYRHPSCRGYSRLAGILGRVEALWCAYIVAVIIAHHAG
jgi:hypothetical protein